MKALGINMAFGTGSESKEGTSFAKYTGIAPFFVLGVNLSKDEMQAIFPDRKYEKEFVYKYTASDASDKDGTYVTFSVRTNTEHKDVKGIDLNSRVSILVKDKIYLNKDGNKVQVINDYGDTWWLTQDEFKNKIVPENVAKQDYSPKGMRPAYIGEEDLVKFLRTYIGIPSSRTYKDGVWTCKTGDDLDKAICGFSSEEIRKIAQGDVSPVRSAIRIQKDNQIKLFVGVRTTDDNKEYQEVCNRIFIRYGTTDYKKAIKDLEEKKAAGSYPNTNFGVAPYIFGEYAVQMSSFQSGSSSSSDDADPFAGFGS